MPRAICQTASQSGPHKRATDEVFEVMHTTAADWDSGDNDDSP